MEYEKVYEEIQIRIPKRDGLTPIGDVIDKFRNEHWDFVGMIDAEDFLYAKFRKSYIHGNLVS